MNTRQQAQEPATFGNTTDAIEYDEPYRFGRTPRAIAPFPFSTRQFARLLVLRGRIRAGQLAADDLAPA